MATTKTTKKKKPSTRSRTEGVFIECAECGKSKSLATNFFKSDRPEYADTGYCNICKDCMKKKMTNPSTGMVDREIFESEICYLLNIPFVPSIYNKILNNPKTTPNTFYADYKRALVVSRDYKDLKYNDSKNFVNDESGLVDQKQEYDQVTEEMIDFWGSGFSARDYIELQKRYDKFMKNEDVEKMEYKKQSDYKMLCHYELKQLELIQDKNAKPSDLKAINDMISKMSEDLNIKAVQKKEDENARGHYIVGLTTKYIENVTLEPIPKFKPEDYRGDLTREEFDIIMAYFKSEMLNELGRENPYQQIVDEDKKKYTPTQKDLTIESVDDEVDEE